MILAKMYYHKLKKFRKKLKMLRKMLKKIEVEGISGGKAVVTLIYKWGRRIKKNYF